MAFLDSLIDKSPVLAAYYGGRVLAQLAGFAVGAGPGGVSEVFEKEWLFSFLGSKKKEGGVKEVFSYRNPAYNSATLRSLTYLFCYGIDAFKRYYKEPEKFLWHEDLISPEIFLAMGLAPFLVEAIPIILPLFNDEKTEHFIDVCENAGYPGDTCTLPKTTIGMVLEDKLPPPRAIVTSNTPCDGGMASYAVMEEKYKVPVFRLDLPYNFMDQRGLDYYLGELKRMIAWLEDVYSVKMNYNRLREVCEERNRMWQYTLDLWDLQRLSPAPIGGETLLFAHLSYQTGGGTRATTRLMRDMLRIARRSIERDGGGIPNERHRAILWNPPPLVYPAMFPWMEKEYGAITVMDMLSYKKNQYIDTSSVESMMRDLARTLAFGPMAQHTRGPCENFFTDLFLMYESFNADMIIMAGHTGCKNTRALLGMFKELCRKRSIPLIIFDYDLSDTRPMPPSGIRKQISDFMENIMGERKGAL